MTAARGFYISLACFIAATFGLISFVWVSFRFFTYQGHGLDWIYPAAGLLILVWFGSATSALITGIAAFTKDTRQTIEKKDGGGVKS